MAWKVILLVITCLILFGNITNAKERDPLVTLLIKKGIITEDEISEMETAIDNEESRKHSYLSETPEDGGYNTNYKETDSNKSNDPGNNGTEIELLRHEVTNIHDEIERLKDGEGFLFKPVKVGFGELEIGGLLQLWYSHDETHGNESGKADSFRLRRSEIMFSGEILPEVAWTVMVDPSKELGFSTGAIDQDTRILQDFLFDLNYIPHHIVSIGQFKLPLTEEGLRSSVMLDTIERSFIGRTFGDHRDIGIQVRGIWEYVDYWLGIFNGSGQNQLDVNDYKDISGRIVLKPFKDLEIGISGLTGRTGTTISDRNRLGGELRYEYNDLSFKGEYMKTKDSKLEREGWYTQVGYFMPFLPQLQGIFKYEEFEDADNLEEKDITVGLNYFINQDQVKLQANYVHKNESKRESDNDQILMALQIAF